MGFVPFGPVAHVRLPGTGRPKTPVVRRELVDPTWAARQQIEAARRRLAESTQVEAATKLVTVPVLTCPLDRRLPEPWTLSLLASVVSLASGISVEAIGSECKFAELVKVRQIGFWLARQFTSKSLPEIGRRLYSGRKFDHTTVLHATNRVEGVIGSSAVSPPMDPTCPYSWAVCLLAAKWPNNLRRSPRSAS